MNSGLRVVIGAVAARRWGGDLEAEIARVAQLGATVLTSSPITGHGWTWHILADPDGNEFCVLQPPPEYWSDH